MSSGKVRICSIKTEGESMRYVFLTLFVLLFLSVSAAPRLHYPDGSVRVLTKTHYFVDTVSRVPVHARVLNQLRFNNKTMVLFSGAQGAYPVYTSDGFPFVVTNRLFYRGNRSISFIEHTYGVKVLSILSAYGIVEFSVPAGKDALELADRIVTDENGFAFPNMMFKQVVKYTPSYPVEDAYYDHEWHLHNTGAYTDLYGSLVQTVAQADIKFDEAMKFLSSQSIPVEDGTKVAVMDSGVVLNHEDLTEIEPGYDAIGDTDGGQPDLSDIDSYSQGEVLSISHGTNCAGVSAAQGNSVGMTGVCPWCGIYPVRYLDPINPTYVDDEQTLKAFKKYAEDSRIVAVNCSFGPPADYGDVPASPGQIEAHKYYLQHGRDELGGAIVYAAGNDNVDAGYNQLMDYHFTVTRNEKTVRTKLVVVAATTAWDTKAVYSDWGDTIDVAAPSLSQNPVLGMATTAIPGYGDFQGDYSLMFSGTSAAAPVVTGLFGVVFSVNPNLTLEEAIAIVESSADKIHPETAFYDKSGHSVKFGYGRVNLLKAVRLAAGEPMCEGTKDEICGNNIDDNCDGFVDEGCRPDMKTGQPCSTDEDCLEEGLSLDEVQCVQQLRYAKTPGGYCIRIASGKPCADGTKAYLADDSTRAYMCAKECTSSVGCAREGYVCNKPPLGRCVPACHKDEDCTEHSRCSESGVCEGIPSPIGGPCNSNADCDDDGYCLPPAYRFPDGYCTKQCQNQDDDYCPSNSKCTTRTGMNGGKMDLCLAECKNDSDCREGYMCHPLMGGKTNVCYKPCKDDAYCTDFNAACNDDGRCVPPHWSGFPEEEPDESVNDADVDTITEDDVVDEDVDAVLATDNDEHNDQESDYKSASACSATIVF